MTVPDYNPPLPHPKASKEERRNVITGTDARRIAAGQWHRLWQEKRGLVQPENLDHIFRVQLGLATEKLHARWHTRQTGDMLFELPDRPCYMPKTNVPAHHAATGDFWVTSEDIPLELKHTNERNNLRDAASYYMAQLQWQLHVFDKQTLRFSIICGNNEPEWGTIAREQSYIDRLVKQVETFWEMVQTGVEPPLDDEGQPDAELARGATQVPINGYKPYDHSTNNAWVVLAAQYVQHKPAAELFKATEKEIRALIPKDASEVTGGGLLFKRDARGAYRCTILEGEL